MYSRNFGIFENLSTVKQNPNIIDSSFQKQNRIPIKTFSDNSAFERFNNLGAVKNRVENAKEESQETNTEAVEENETNNSIDTETPTHIYENESNKNDIQPKAEFTVSEEKKHILFPLDIKNLSGVFDSDFLLIALALAMLIFGNDETNDKLTPIALLAIMFL